MAKKKQKQQQCPGDKCRKCEVRLKERTKQLNARAARAQAWAQMMTPMLEIVVPIIAPSITEAIKHLFG